MTLLSDDDIFGKPQPTPRQPQLLSDDDVFGPQEPASFVDYARELATGAASGLKGFFAQALRGQAASDPMPSIPGESEAEFQLRQEEWRRRPQVPIQQNPLWQAGEALDQAGNSVLGATPGWEGSWTRDIGGGLGSVGSMIGLSLLNPAAAMYAGVAAGQGEAAQRAIQSGASEEVARRAAHLGSAAGATEMVDALIPFLGSAGAAAGFIRRVGVPIVAAALAEGGQEALQGLIQNAIAKNLYKPEQDLSEGLARQAAVGAIVGGGVRAGSQALGYGTRPDNAVPTAEEMAIARATLTGQPVQPGRPSGVMGVEELEAILASLRTPAGSTTTVTSGPNTAAAGPPLTDEEVFGPAAPTRIDQDYPPVAPGMPQGGGFVPPATVPRSGPELDPSSVTNPPDPSGQDWRRGTDLPPFQYDDQRLADLDRVRRTMPPPPGQVIEGEVLPPLPSDGSVVPPDIVDFVHRKSKPLTVPEKPLGFSDLMNTNAALREEVVEGQPGADVERLARLLGSTLYGDPTHMAKVSVKEILQNSFDGIKGIIAKTPGYQGNIDVDMNRNNRTITVKDNGSGMTPEVLGNQFLQIAGTKKESDRASGGLGIAKMMFLFENKSLNVVTARNGKVATMTTSGPELRAAMGGRGPKPQITVRKMGPADHKAFPSGSGTMIQVEVPKAFRDPSTGEDKEIDFDDWDDAHPVLRDSPLFDDINVRFNGRDLAMGNKFPVNDYTQFANVNFDWGTARIYVSNGPPQYSWRENAHVLSNGLWQFSFGMNKDPGSWEKINRTFYIDVGSRVKPEEPGYPFALNRQEFAPSVRKDFEKIFNYIQLVYQQADHDVSVENFGTLQFLEFDEATGRVRSTGERKLVPPDRTENPVTALKTGDSVTVRDGKLIVNGREIPELDPKDLEAAKIDVSKLKIPQSEIDPNSIILHDNTLVPATGTPLDQMATSTGDADPFAQQPLIDPNDATMPRVALSQLAADRFGGRFYEFTFLMGGLFRQLRDVISTFEVNEPSTSTGLKNYSGLREEGIGISFDPEYRGVSIRVPFSASFLNIAIPVRTDPGGAAINMVQTMVHELAHHVHRSEKGLAPVMQDIYTQLDLSTTFDFQRFKQKAINVVASYHDVFMFLNGAYKNGLVTTGGKRFADASSEPRGDGSVVGGEGDGTSRAARGHRISDWRPLGQSTVGTGDGRADAGSRVEGAGTGRDPSFGKNTNQRALDREAGGQDAQQFQPEIIPTRQAVHTLFGGSTPTQVAALAAHADRMNLFYKYMVGITQLADANPEFTPLLRYNETVRMMHSDEARIHDAALRINKDWRNLGAQGDNLTLLLHDLANMVYLTPQEQTAGVERLPTQAEMDALVTKHKVGRDALKVFGKIRGLQRVFLDNVVAVQIDRATRGMTDPVKIQQKTGQILAAKQAAENRPYFPFMNFGRHYLEVTNAAGDTVHFETFERNGLFRSAERIQMAAVRKAEKFYAARGLGEVVKHGILSDAATPFMGMPPQLLDSIRDTLNLSQQQLDALDKLRLQSRSATSFSKKFTNRGVAPGYSMDFKRAFAKYFFHGARYYAKTKYVPFLTLQIDAAGQVNGNKAAKITEYMNDHLENSILDAKGDHGLFKGAIFLWAMGYVPAAAFQNMSQTPMVTYPFLWAKFGNLSATAALTRAFASTKTYLRKGTYEAMVSGPGAAEFELRALDYGIKSGRITETQSAELAGLSQAEGLISGIGGTWAQQKTVAFQEKAAWMFEMAEQFNRRLAYRAGLYLGQTKPNSKEVQLAVKKYNQEFLELQTRNFTDAQARAIVTAIHVTDQTQYVYARYARARFMRGRLPGTIFVFKQYLQSTLMLMARNKKDVFPRMMLMWALMGGLAAFPGWEDIREIIKGVARWRFGKDFDIEKELRAAIMEFGGDESTADLVLHGFARKGFGVPAMLDLMGSLYTGKPGRGLQLRSPAEATPGNTAAPVVDMSRQISMGSILPFEFGKMVSPDKPSSVIGEQTQRASGAVFSVGFNIYKAMWDNRAMSDPKRWEKAVPRALASTSRMFRAYTEGRERTNLGGEHGAATVVNYDVRDTEHLMEMIAIGMGFQTERVAARWDRIMAQVETEKFFESKRKGLMAQYFEAQKGGLEKEIEAVRDLIQQHNERLPDYARGYVITGDSLRRSVQTRARDLDSREAGVPTRRSAIPVQQYLDQLYPGSSVDMRRAR